jgi:hypothetical protein
MVSSPRRLLFFTRLGIYDSKSRAHCPPPLLDSSRQMSSSYAAHLASPAHAGKLATMRDWSGAWFAAERERWPLWMPVMVGLGIAAYFGLSEEPPPWLDPMIVAGVGLPGLVVLGRRTDRSGRPLPAGWRLQLGLPRRRSRRWPLAHGC